VNIGRNITAQMESLSSHEHAFGQQTVGDNRSKRDTKTVLEEILCFFSVLGCL